MSRRRARRGCSRGCAGAAALVCVAFALAGMWFQVQLRPVGAGHGRVVRVARGVELRALADRLRSYGLIRHAGVFYAYARLRGDGERIRAGRYRLSPSMSPGRILDKLVHGRQDLDGLVVIPEGFTVKRIAERLSAKRILAGPSAFMRMARSGASGVEAPFPLPAIGLEGYLFPSSYDFEPGATPEAVAQAMVNEFTAEFYEPYRDEIAGCAHSLHEIVTIASMIEREAEVERDRALIAGVIENRLRRGMRLQIDATVLYGMGYHKSRLLYRDLRTPSPYNTYLHAGLPPGPIANPGLASLLAALRPARHDYLFYVAAPDRSHVFTRTEAEHNRAVAELRRRRNAGSR